MVNFIVLFILVGIFSIIGLLIYLSLLEAKDVKNTFDKNSIADTTDLAEQEFQNQLIRASSTTQTFGPG